MPVSFVHTGDGHIDSDTHGTINPQTGLNRAWESHAATLRNAVTAAVDRDVDLFIHAGDAFKAGKPSQEAVLMFADVLKPLLRAHIPVVLLGGNHERIMVPLAQRTATETLRDLLAGEGEIHVVERDPALVRVGDGIQIAAMPWQSKSRVLHRLGHTDLDPVEGDRKVADYLTDQLHDLAAAADPSAPFIMAAHATVDDVRVDSLANGARRGSEMDMAQVFAEPIVPRASIEQSPVSYAALSHIHARQQIGGKCFYAGSPDRFTMTDADEPKTVNVVTVSDTNELANVEQVDTGARAMHSITVADAGADDQIAALTPGALVRLVLPPGESMAPDTMRAAIDDAGARVVETKTTPKERSRSTGATLPESVHPEQALRAWFKKVSPQGVDEDYAVQLTTQMIGGN